MAAPESAPAGLPGAAEGDEETILYDLLVNTEWPPETEVQVTPAPLGGGQPGAQAARQSHVGRAT